MLIPQTDTFAMSLSDKAAVGQPSQNLRHTIERSPMKRLEYRLAAATVAVAVACLAPPAQAYVQATHNRIVRDAVDYMRAHPDTTNYEKLVIGAQLAGYTIEQFTAIMAQGAQDVDTFEDTFLCGAITGDCVKAPLWGLGTDIARYTSFWHFQDHAHGEDVHGNPYGGYGYRRVAIMGDIDVVAAGWLWNDYLDDGRGGMDGIFGDTSRYNTYGITEAHYRQGGYSTKSMYDDYQDFPFQPVNNLGQYWFSQFLIQPTAQNIGFVLHTTDATVPQHTWNTLGNEHADWESWVYTYYDQEQLGAHSLVQQALKHMTPLAPHATDVRSLVYQAGAYSYGHGTLVLLSSDHADRVQVGRDLVPHAIALVVHILNRAAERLAS